MLRVIYVKIQLIITILIEKPVFIIVSLSSCAVLVNNKRRNRKQHRAREMALLLNLLRNRSPESNLFGSQYNIEPDLNPIKQFCSAATYGLIVGKSINIK